MRSGSGGRKAAWAGPSFGLDMLLILPFPGGGGVRAGRVGHRVLSEAAARRVGRSPGSLSNSRRELRVSGGLAQDARGAIAAHSVDEMKQLVKIVDTLDGPINVYDDSSEEFFEVPRDPKKRPTHHR